MFTSRSDTPLIYKAVPGWFVKVESFVDRLLVNNKASYWYVLRDNYFWVRSKTKPNIQGVPKVPSIEITFLLFISGYCTSGNSN